MDIRIAYKDRMKAFDIDDLKALQGDLKTLSEESYRQLRKEIEETGFAFAPHVWVDQNSKAWLVDGHQRFETLKRMRADGLSVPKIPVVSVEAKSLRQAKRRVLQGTSQYGEMTDKGLKDFLIESKIDIKDVELSFRFPEIDLPNFVNEHFRDSAKDETEDEIPEPLSKPKVKPGELYQLGEHRLLCGDSTNIKDVDRLMNGEKALLMVTDPPYGVQLDQSWRDDALGHKALGKGNKNLIANDNRADWFDVWKIAPVEIAYIWHASIFTDVVMESLRKASFDIRQQIIWNKSVMVMGRGHYHFKHEPCWYAVKHGSKSRWVGDRKQTTVWDASPPNHIMGGSKEEKTGHPTQKPLKLYEIPIENHTKQDDSLFEPFGGSGTALIASEKTSRRCYAMEIDPIYCGVILDRWAKYTDKDPVRSDGVKWSEIRQS